MAAAARPANGGTRRALHAAVIAAAVFIPLQIVAGDLHGLNTLSTSPRRSPHLRASGRPERRAAHPVRLAQ